MARSFVKMIQNSRDQFAIIFVRKRRRRRSGVGGGSNTKEYQSAWEKDFQEGDRRAGSQAGGRECGGRTSRTNPHQSTTPPSPPRPSEWSGPSMPQRKKVCGPTDAKPLRRIYGRTTPAPPARARVRPLPLSNIQLIVSPYKTHNLSFLDIVQRRRTNG